MLAGGLERSGQRNAGDPTFWPHPPLTNPPAAGGAGGLFTHTHHRAQFTRRLGLAFISLDLAFMALH